MNNVCDLCGWEYEQELQVPTEVPELVTLKKIEPRLNCEWLDRVYRAFDRAVKTSFMLLGMEGYSVPSGKLMYLNDGPKKPNCCYIFANEQGKIHRDDGPAIVVVDYRRCVLHRAWMNKGKLHRVGGDPAKVVFSKDELSQVGWYERGLMHRKEGPAELNFDVDGNLDSEGWYLKGELHRVGGPARINYKSGVVFSREWFLKGVPCPNLRMLDQAVQRSPQAVAGWIAKMTDKVSPEVRRAIRDAYATHIPPQTLAALDWIIECAR